MEGTCWIFGDGEHDDFWRDSWLLDSKNGTLTSIIQPATHGLKPKDFPLIESFTKDSITWWPNISGEYIVKQDSCARQNLLILLFQVEGEWDRIWKLKVPSSYKAFCAEIGEKLHCYKAKN